MKKICAIFGFLVLFSGLFTSVTVAQLKSEKPTHKVTSPNHEAKIWVESAELCPGQEVELGIYVNLKIGPNLGYHNTCATLTQKQPDPIDNFMFYLYIEDTSAAEVVCSYTDHRSPTYRVGYPILSEKMPELDNGSLVCSYVEGDGYRVSNQPERATKGTFACIWMRNSNSVKLLPDGSKPLFKIRVRLKKEQEVKIGFDYPEEVAFSSGLSIYGGYWYRFESGDDNCQLIGNGKLRLAKGPAKSLVSAGPDELQRICVRDRVTFNAEGGLSYQWTQCYNPAYASTGGYNYEHLSNRNTKNPTFYPEHSGEYIYEVKAYDTNGCFTRDTVHYYVEQNYLQYLTIDPQHTMIDSGSRVKLNVKGALPQGLAQYLKPLKLTLEPDSLFAAGKNTLKTDNYLLSGSFTTKAIKEPTLIVATLQDTVCKIQKTANIRINGLKVSGKISTFPVFRCGDDREEKSLTLNVMLKGGSDKFLYNWYVTDLEFSENSEYAPRIENAQSQSAKLFYHGLCAVHVDIYDAETDEMITISDTMRYRDWLKAEARVTIDTAEFLKQGYEFGKPFCSGITLPYKVHGINAGKTPKYAWQINGLWKREGVNDTTFTAGLNKGDSVSCVLFSSENCVSNKAVGSAFFAPDIRNIAQPSVEICNADEGNKHCNTVEILATCHMLGKRFRMQWLRNNVLEKDTVIETDNPEWCEVTMHFPHKGYYDGFRCRVVESDMPCGNFDTVRANVCISDVPNVKMEEGDQSGAIEQGNALASGVLYPGYKAVMYANSNTVKLPEITGISMPQEAVCQDAKFTLRAHIENMPKDYELYWYRKKGKDSVLLGFYTTAWNDAWNNKSFSDAGCERVDYFYYCLNGGTNGEKSSKLLYTGNAGLTEFHVFGSNVTTFQNGYPITLNDPNTKFACPAVRNGFTSQDTVYFVLVSKFLDGCEELDYNVEVQTHTMRSPYFSPKILETKPLPDLTVDYVEKTKLCGGMGHSYHLAASFPGEEYYKLDWKFRGFSVTDSVNKNGGLGDMRQYFRLLGTYGDTLEGNLVMRKPKGSTSAGTEFTCTATVLKGCHAGKTQTVTKNLDEYVADKPFFGIAHAKDTIVCANQAVEHRAKVVEFPDKTMTDQGAGEISTVKNYEIKWANTLQDLKAGNYAASGETYTVTPTPNDNQPNGTGNKDDNRGIFHYYVQAKETYSGCTVIDSIAVMVGHPYEVKARLEYIYPGEVWCDSADYVTADAQRKVEGRAYRKGVQYAVVRTENAGKTPLMEWFLNGRALTKGTNYDSLDMGRAPNGDTLCVRMTAYVPTCLNRVVTTEALVIRSVQKGDLYSNAPKTAKPDENVLLQAYSGDHKVKRTILGNYNYFYELLQASGDWGSLGTGSSVGKAKIDTFRLQMPNQRGAFRVTSHDKYGVCPDQHNDINIALAVPNSFALKVLDPDTKREIKGLCPQSYDFVYADKQAAPVKTTTLFVNDTRKPMNVLLHADVQNPGQNAYVVYYKNNAAFAMGPVGSTDKLPFDTAGAKAANVRVLARGEEVLMPILPGDYINAFFRHDTININGHNILTVSNFHFKAIDTVGRLVVDAEPTAVCWGESTSLSARFEKAAASVTWNAAPDFASNTNNPATTVVKQTAVYSAIARDPNGCAWKDSVLVKDVAQDHLLPLGIEADALRFCGSKASVKVQLNRKKSSPEDFEKFDWYVVEATGNRLIESNATGVLQTEVTHGMKLMVQAKPKAACQRGLSQSDTLQFTGYEYPVLTRKSIFAGDTAVCAGSTVVCEYQAADNMQMKFTGVWGIYQEVLQDTPCRFEYETGDENMLMLATARNKFMPACAVTDTLKIAVMTTQSGAPTVNIIADKNAVCGAESVVYTAATRYTDQLIWVENNNKHIASSNTLGRIPRAVSAQGVRDTVYALAIRFACGCVSADTAKSAPIVILRTERPVLRLLSRDTTVSISKPVALRAEATASVGSTPAIEWYDRAGTKKGSGSPYTVTHDKQGDYLYHAMAIQTEYRNLLPRCYSHDSITIVVEDPSAAPEVHLNADRKMVCGAQEITYTATTKNTDRLIWIANGKALNETGNTLKRVPRLTGFDSPVDSVYALALRVHAEENRTDTTKSNIVRSWHMEKPELKLFNGDTSVYEGSTVILRAEATAYDGPEPIIGWYNVKHEELHEGGTYETTHPKKGDYRYYVAAYQAELEDVLPECYSYDSLNIHVEQKVAVEENETASLQVHPNPSTGRFIIQTKGDSRIEIYSLTGDLVWFRDKVNGKTEAYIRQTGIFFVKAFTPQGIVIQKLVIR